MAKQINAFTEDETTVAEYVKQHVSTRYGKKFTVLIRPNGRVRLLNGSNYPAEDFAHVVGVYTRACPLDEIKEQIADFLRNCARTT